MKVAGLFLALVLCTVCVHASSLGVESRLSSLSTSKVSIDREALKDQITTTMSALTEAGVYWWTDFGTLLGVIRDGDIVKGDDDADLGIWKTEAKKLPAVHKALLADGYTLVKSKNNVFKVYPSDCECVKNNFQDMEFALYCPDCLNVDLFQYETGSKCMKRACWESWTGMDNVHCGGVSGSSFPKHYVSKIVDYTVKAWDNFVVKVPEHYNRFLAFRYGDSWRTPKKGDKGPDQGCTE